MDFWTNEGDDTDRQRDRGREGNNVIKKGKSDIRNQVNRWRREECDLSRSLWHSGPE